MWETRVRSLGREDPLEEGMATHSSILAGRIPWTEEPGGLQSMGSQRVGNDWATHTRGRKVICTKVGSCKTSWSSPQPSNNHTPMTGSSPNPPQQLPLGRERRWRTKSSSIRNILLLSFKKKNLKQTAQYLWIPGSGPWVLGAHTLLSVWRRKREGTFEGLKTKNSSFNNSCIIMC